MSKYTNRNLNPHIALKLLRKLNQCETPQQVLHWVQKYFGLYYLPGEIEYGNGFGYISYNSNIQSFIFQDYTANPITLKFKYPPQPIDYQFVVNYYAQSLNTWLIEPYMQWLTNKNKL